MSGVAVAVNKNAELYEYIVFSTNDGGTLPIKPTPPPPPVTGIAEDDGLSPDNFFLYQNYPNPFNPETIIQYRLPRDSKIKINIYNLLGQKVSTLLSGNMLAGVHGVNWDGVDERGKKVPSGVYIYRLEVAGNAVSKKMVLLQ